MEDIDEDYEALGNDSLAINMLAGALAGISEHAVMFPLDSIKTRMQVMTMGAPAGSGTATAAIYTSVSDALTRISTTEGSRRLWKGVASVILGAGPAHAVYFGTYELSKEFLCGSEQYSFSGTALSGALATICSDALMNPFDVVKQRMQVHGSRFETVGACFRDVYKAEGIAAFYVSYPTTLTMTVPFTAVQFATYEYLKDRLNPSHSYSPLTHIVSGGIAGGVAGAVTTPLDVCKTLLQTRGTSADPTIRHAKGMGDAFRLIWEYEGIRGFWRGLSPRIMTNVPSSALCWLSYEGFRRLLKLQSAPNANV